MPEERKTRMLDYLQRNESITTITYTKLNACSRYQATADLKKYVEEMMLYRVGGSTHVTYLLAENPGKRYIIAYICQNINYLSKKMENKIKYKIPYAVMNFAKIREDNYYFVDKTNYIAELENTKYRSSCAPPVWKKFVLHDARLLLRPERSASFRAAVRRYLDRAASYRTAESLHGAALGFLHRSDS